MFESGGKLRTTHEMEARKELTSGSGGQTEHIEK
jgi:hypothetical protein